MVEIGAGSGTMTERLCAHADTVIASDLSPARVDELRARFGGNDKVEVVQGDAAAVIAGRTVDAVVMVNVLEHLDDDVKVLTQLRESLRPGGVVALVRARTAQPLQRLRPTGRTRSAIHEEHVGDDAQPGRLRGARDPLRQRAGRHRMVGDRSHARADPDIRATRADL